jgi:hypothetical protein
MQAEKKSSKRWFIFYAGYAVAVWLIVYFYLYGDDAVSRFCFLGMLAILLPWSLVTGLPMIGSMYHGANSGIPEMAAFTAFLNLLSFHFAFNWINDKR